MIRKPRPELVNASLPLWVLSAFVVVAAVTACASILIGVNLYRVHQLERDLDDVRSQLNATRVTIQQLNQTSAINLQAADVALSDRLQILNASVIAADLTLSSRLQTLNVTDLLLTAQLQVLNASTVAAHVALYTVIAAVNQSLVYADVILANNHVSLDAMLRNTTLALQATDTALNDSLRSTGASIGVSLDILTQQILGLNTTKHNFTQPVYFEGGLWFRPNASFRSFVYGSVANNQQRVASVEASWSDELVTPSSGAFREVYRPSSSLRNWYVIQGGPFETPLFHSIRQTTLTAMGVSYAFFNNETILPTPGFYSMSYRVLVTSGFVAVGVRQDCHPQGSIFIPVRRVEPCVLDEDCSFSLDSFYGYPCALTVQFNTTLPAPSNGQIASSIRELVIYQAL